MSAGTLTIADLFTPSPSGVGSATAPAGSWLAQELNVAAQVQLPATAWEAGGIARTLLALDAVCLAQQDAMISLLVQSGFLQWAATGSVTYVDTSGATVTQAVTPDPSDPAANPTGALGALDVLADQLYDVQRVEPTYAAGTLYLVNASGASIGPLDAGQFHVAAAAVLGGPTYANAAALTLPASSSYTISAYSLAGTTVDLGLDSVAGIAAGQILYLGVTLLSSQGVTGLDGAWVRVLTVNATTKHITFLSTTASGALSGSVVAGAWLPTAATFRADFSGSGSSAGPDQITTLVSGYPGVYVDNAAAFVGGTWENNTALAARCQLKLQALSPNGAAGAYSYLALSASQYYTDTAIPVQGVDNTYVAMSQAITKVLVSSSTATGVTTVTAANADGVPAGLVQKPVTGATNATPIVVTVDATTGLVDGDYVYLAGVGGNTSANGYWTIANTTGTTFELVGSIGNGAWTAGGTVEGGDLGLLDLLLNQRVVPQAVTETTQPCSTLTVAVVATVTVPTAQIAAYQAAASLALAVWFAALPIGGISGGVVPLAVVEGVLYAAGIVGTQPSYVQQIASLTLNGVAADAALTAYQDAILGTVTLTMVGS